MQYFNVLLFSLFTITLSCNQKAEKNGSEESSKNTPVNNLELINSIAFLEKNLESCIKDYSVVRSKNNHKNWATADYDLDGIKEISGLFKNQDTVKLIVVDRDNDGNCSKKYVSKNLTNKLVGKDQYVQVQSSMSTRLAKPSSVTNHISFTFESSEYDLKLTFYYNAELDDYCLLTSDYIINENDQLKEGQIIAKDYLKNEKRTRSKIGSRKNIVSEKFESTQVKLSTLDYQGLINAVK